jgi:hypothetical protein
MAAFDGAATTGLRYDPARLISGIECKPGFGSLGRWAVRPANVRIRTESKHSKFSLKQNAVSVVITEQAALCLRLKWTVAMCAKCLEIDKTIERYRRILLAIDDKTTIDRAKEMIADLQAQKVALHPGQPQ